MPDLGITRTHEQGDCASLVSNGACYLCYVWRDAARHSIESAIYAIQEDGAEVLLHQQTVRVETGEDPFELTLPKVLSTGTVFVCHFLYGQSDGPATLYHAWIDVEDIDNVSTWTQHAGPSCDDSWIYDVHVNEGGTGWVIAYQDDTSDLIFSRYNAVGWPAAVWTNNYGVDSDGSAIAVWANATATDAVMVFQGVGGTANTLQCTRVQVSNGGGSATTEIMEGLGADDWSQIAICTRSPSGRTVFVAVEGHTLDGSLMVNYVAGTIVSSQTAGDASSTARAWNCGLLSRPWAHIGSANNGREEIYSVICHRPITELDMSNRVAFVVNWDAQRMVDASADFVCRPRCVVNLNNGTVDCRIAGYHTFTSGTSDLRHSCHVSSAAVPPTYGPGRKSRTVALLTFQKAMTISDGAGRDGIIVVPTQAAIVGHRVYMEDPWTTDRGGQYDPGALTASFRGTYPDLVQTFEAGRALWIGGGTPYLYDGVQTVEAGFPWVPDIFRVAVTDATTTGLVPGNYSWLVTLEWVDHKGQLHRSGPSAIVSVVTADFGVFVTGRITMDVSTLTISLRDNADWYPAGANINIVVWRTLEGGSTFYRLHGATDGLDASYVPGETPVNDPTDYTIEVIDDFGALIGDVSLDQHEIFPHALQLDGTWNPLEPQSVPSFLASTFWRNSVVGIPAEDPRTIMPSLEILPAPGAVPPTAPEFNAAMGFRIDGLGLCTALATVDDVLVLFTRDAVYGVTGFPPDATGANSTLEIRQYPSQYGCIDARSVCVFPGGVMFQSTKGICSMDRQGNVVYIGQDVEDVVIAGGNVRAATHMEDRSEVRFVMNEGPADDPIILSYDYNSGLWARHVLPLADMPGGETGMSSAVHGTVWRGPSGEQLHVALEEQAILIERPTTNATPYADSTRFSTQAVALDIQTGWITLTGLTGYKRVRYLGLQLEVFNNCQVTITVESDLVGSFTTTPSQTFVEDMTTTRKYLKLPLAQQRCTAIRVRVFESSNTTVPTTQNLAILGMSIYYGRYPGDRKIPDSQVGT